MKINKKILIAIIIAIIILIISTIIYYKFAKNGNTTINESDEQILQDILNISSYSAKIEIEITSNKNNNKYIIKQEVQNGTSRQEVIEPENIQGLVTEYDGKNLKIKNSKLNLTTIYEDYEYIAENKLWLNSFIEEYKNSSNKNMKTSENEIILETQNVEDKYNTYKTLYIDKKTKKPTKMVISDINKKDTVYILYNEIKIS